jgi:hypothetical protein
MRLIHWVIFGAGQCAGLILPQFANIGPCSGNYVPLLLAGLFLFPGDLTLFVSLNWVDSLPVWEAYLLAGIPIVGVNALVWYLVGKLDEPKVKSSSGVPGFPAR